MHAFGRGGKKGRGRGGAGTLQKGDCKENSIPARSNMRTKQAGGRIRGVSKEHATRKSKEGRSERRVPK